MVQVTDLWLPILVSAAIVFVASSIIWMATPIHKNDYKSPGDKEGPLLAWLRQSGLTPGVYFVPWCQGSQAKDPSTQQRMKEGPWALLTVQSGPPIMGKMLGLWFLHLLIVGFFVAYVASHAGLAPGAKYLSVFRIVGATALIAHAGYALPMAIWHGMPWSQLPGRLFDGVVYCLLTAGTFAWLWPDAPTGA
jgi:hypothetical protein